MSVKIKAGTNFILPVVFKDTNFADVSAIEFLFKQDMKGDTLKSAYWSANGESRDAVKSSADNTVLVYFSRDDTYKFKQNAAFYMDTRIHYTDAYSNPYTKIMGLQMSGTLFASGEEVTANG